MSGSRRALHLFRALTNQQQNVLAIGTAQLPYLSHSALYSSLSHSNPEQPRLVLKDVDHFVHSLNETERTVLAAALAKVQYPEHEAYIDQLFKAADSDLDSVLTRGEFQQAILAHKTFAFQEIKKEPEEPPSSKALGIIFLASAIPFVVFGFLDNFIMIVAGEEIDHLFGAKLGLSTLMSAGLGNMLADVVGVSVAKYIEQAVRKLPFIQQGPVVSKVQASMRSTKVTKMLGCSIGVMFGCLLGLMPLVVTGAAFTS